jgi:hypothetical protein
MSKSEARVNDYSNIDTQAGKVTGRSGWGGKLIIAMRNASYSNSEQEVLDMHMSAL